MFKDNANHSEMRALTNTGYCPSHANGPAVHFKTGLPRQLRMCRADGTHAVRAIGHHKARCTSTTKDFHNLLKIVTTSICITDPLLSFSRDTFPACD